MFECEKHPALPVGDALVFLQDAVVPGDGVGEVGQQGDVHGPQTTLLPGSVDPNGRTDGHVNWGQAQRTRHFGIPFKNVAVTQTISCFPSKLTFTQWFYAVLR